MPRKTNREDRQSHYGKGRMRAAEFGKGRKVRAAMKREVWDLDLDALAGKVA